MKVDEKSFSDKKNKAKRKGVVKKDCETLFVYIFISSTGLRNLFLSLLKYFISQITRRQNENRAPRTRTGDGGSGEIALIDKYKLHDKRRTFQIKAICPALSKTTRE